MIEIIENLLQISNWEKYLKLAVSIVAFSYLTKEQQQMIIELEKKLIEERKNV